VADVAAWSDWLSAHHAEPAGVWLVLARTGTSHPTSLTHDQALEEALCQGWIDGQTRRRDGATYLQRFTPRRPRSRWSRRNVDLVERLRDQGRMQPAGEAAAARAVADGRWQAAYAGPASIQVPDDLAAALAAAPRAAAMFEILTSQNRYSILYRLTTASQAATRARRLQQFVDMLDRGQTVYPQARRLDR
jgi:uncharacterized protein YdeI (YjbR/CyaY-like superfamily)